MEIIGRNHTRKYGIEEQPRNALLKDLIKGEEIIIKLGRKNYK